MPSPSLQVQQLAIARGDRSIVEDLDFAVAPGEILHLRGRNGAGKTSLLEVLCGLRQPAAGTIEGQPEPERRHWLGHKNALNPALSAEENLRFWCALNGHAHDGVVPALERLGLKALRHHPCGKLSTGQRRRAALARLLAAPRPWWFLDEPLAGLDHGGIDLLAGLLETQVRGGGAVLLTSHQPLAGPAAVRTLELA